MAFAPGPNVALAPFFSVFPEGPLGFSAKITCGPPPRRLAKKQATERLRDRSHFTRKGP